MKHLSALVFCLGLFSGFSYAQVIGSDTVCAGYIYNYSVNVPGAVSYVWTVPSGWYDLTGQGTSQISVTCNVNDGDVCVESFDSNVVSLGTQCLTTNFGGGGGSYHLEPSGQNHVCDNISSVSLVPVLVYDSAGGGGCLPGCGSGIPHPNIVFAIYDGSLFQGIVGDTISFGVDPPYFYTVSQVDTTNGSNFLQAIEISGCGGSVTGSFSFAHINYYPTYSTIPNIVCIGDTFLLDGNPNCPGSFWSNLTNLIVIAYPNWYLQVVATGSPIIYTYNTCFIIPDGVAAGSSCWSSRVYIDSLSNCSIDASFSVNDSIICEDNCLSFTNSTIHAYNYQWFFPGGSPASSTNEDPTNICYTDTGVFDVTLIASNPGFSDTLYLPGYIHVVSIPQAGFSVSQTELCPGSCADFYNQSIYGSYYYWNFPGAVTDSSTDENPAMICYSDSGQYDVTLISSNGYCSDTLTALQTISVYPAPPLVSIQQSGDTLYASPGFSSYQWYLDGNLISGATGSFYFCTSNGDYNVIAFDTNGCEVEAAIYNVMTNIPQMNAAQSFFVYPNPARDHLNIALPPSWMLNQSTTLKIMDTQDRLVFFQSLKNQTIDVGDLTEGVYVIEIIEENAVLRTSFLKGSD